jgi:hypothetical protein
VKDLGTILLAYGAVLGAIGGYAAFLMRRSRQLGRGVADEDKPWT